MIVHDDVAIAARAMHVYWRARVLCATAEPQLSCTEWRSVEEQLLGGVRVAADVPAGRPACAGLPVRWWFEDAWSDLRQEPMSGLERAQAICRGCPAAVGCLEGALARREGYGVWAATTPEDRRRIRRKRLDIHGALRYAGLVGPGSPAGQEPEEKEA